MKKISKIISGALILILGTFLVAIVSEYGPIGSLVGTIVGFIIIYALLVLFSVRKNILRIVLVIILFIKFSAWYPIAKEYGIDAVTHFIIFISVTLLILLTTMFFTYPTHYVKFTRRNQKGSPK